MSLADTLKAGPQKQPEPCIVARALAPLSDTDRGAFNDVAVPGVNQSWLRRKLAEHGVDVTRTSLREHINGDCCCDG